MKLSISEIAQAAGGVISKKYEDKIITKVTIDSRKADCDTLFIPFVGEKVDGHDFILSASEKGCPVCFSEQERDGNLTVIRVDNCEKALGRLAKYWLDKVNPLRVAITGSVGKTTTRDLVAAVVKKYGTTLKTQGNFNNNIGLPLTVLGLTDEKAVVLEMGMDCPGEIDYLSEIVHPDIGVITNIGYSHLERLGSRENIFKAKTEILANLKDDGVMVLCGDDDFLTSLKDRDEFEKIYYGCENEICDFRIKVIDERTGKFEIDGYAFETGLPGVHNMYNAAAAVAVGRLLEVSDAEICDGLKCAELTGMRLSFEKQNGYTVICDCYNAAPDSMRASLRVLKDAEGKRKIAVLAAINELGEARDSLLYEIGKFAAEIKIDKLVTVGPEALFINKGAREAGLADEINLKNNDEAKKYLLSMAREGDVFLVKGSRGFRLEEICDYLLRKEDKNV